MLNPSYQERRTINGRITDKFMNESAKRHEENSTMLKKYGSLHRCYYQKLRASIKTLEIQISIGQETSKRGIAENVLAGLDTDPYLDEGMGDVVVGEPFCKASCVETRRFNGIITMRDGHDSVTYQMVRSHLRFKHLTNMQCNKIPPLLKVSEQDKMNGISHSYQKLKGFYKGVLNLGSEFNRDAKVEERLTCGDIRMHEME
ncbi:hypothetical protein Tco_1365077 [Tanacetum coccineum]